MEDNGLSFTFFGARTKRNTVVETRSLEKALYVVWKERYIYIYIVVEERYD